MRLTWPLTGRSRETRLIEAALLDPDSAGVVVGGAAGVGKSRIAWETLDALKARQWEIRWVVGTSAARHLPLGALAPWVRCAGDRSLVLVHGVIDALTSSPDSQPMVIGVDDVPLLDDLSTVVVHQIIQRRLAKVLLTLRDGEPVRAATRELWKVGEFDRVDVRPLTPAATAALVAAAVGGRVNSLAAERLWELTEGNPLYLRLIVEQEVADGRLACRDGMWTWAGGPVIPPDLVELVESRIGGLTEPVSDVIDVLAVGEPMELHALTEITGATAVEEADRRGLICFQPAHGTMEVRLAHPLYGEVRRAHAAQTRLRRLRSLVVSELARSQRHDDVHIVVRRAALSLESDLEPDAELLLKAARGATWLLDLPLADRLARAAIESGEKFEASLTRAFVLSWLGNGKDAESVLAEVDTGPLTTIDRSRLVFLRAANLFFSVADPDAAKDLVDRATALSAIERRTIDAFLCIYWAAMGNPAAAREVTRRFDPDQLPGHLQRHLTMWAVTVACGEAGSTGEAADTAQSAYPISIRAFVAVVDPHINALLLAGRTADAQDVAQAMRGRATAPGGTPFGQIALAATGQAALGAGCLEQACSCLASALDRVTPWNTATGFSYRYRILLTTALAMRGLTEEALAGRADIEADRHPSWRYLDYAHAIADAWVLGSQGALREAIATVRAAAGHAGARGQFAAEVMCLQTATQFGDASTARRLTELAAIVEGPRVAVAADFAVSLQSGNADEIETASGRFESIGDLVGAVDSAAHASICFRRKNLRGSALRCSARAQALAKRCGGARTPALRLSVEQLPLTDRERQIVMLLGATVSNRDIAARLNVSVRTVESHIYNAMAKTGTVSREELAALLAGVGPQPG